MPRIGVYRAGDVIETGYFTTAGYVTSGGTEFNFTVPLDKPVHGTISITRLELIVRQNGNYLVGSGSGYSDVTSRARTNGKSNSHVHVCAVMASAPSGVQNNGAVGIQAIVEMSVS